MHAVRLGIGIPAGSARLERDGTGARWKCARPRPRRPGQLFRLCSNGEQHQVCNWLVHAEDPEAFCIACRLNEMIPDLTVPGNLERWSKLEIAKRRMIYTLLRLGLPMHGVPAENRPALRFCFLGKPAAGPEPFTGHDDGTITINIAEADDAERELRRVKLHEPYRTLVGHLRHEIAHYYWDQFIARTHRVDRFRQIFGNEEIDYDTALKQFYQQGPPADWQDRHISAYASSHPWEDWAETWAHYLHIIDTVETAVSFGLTLHPSHPDARQLRSDPIKAADLDTPFDQILAQWLPLTCAVNSLNRSMGLPDLYPFLLSPPVIEKLKFVHEVIRASRVNSRATESLAAAPTH